MTEKEKEQLRMKLAEFAGFVVMKDNYKGDRYTVGWEYPDDSKIGALPDFPNDLAACFRWLVPQHKRPIVGVQFHYFPGGTRCELTYITAAGFDAVESWVQAESRQADYDGEACKLTSLALCLAFEKLVDLGMKDIVLNELSGLEELVCEVSKTIRTIVGRKLDITIPDNEQ